MGRTLSAIRIILLSLSLVAGLPLIGNAVLTDTDLCPGTGAECVISTKIPIRDPGGIDITHPDPAGSPPLTLHITSTGVLAADPAVPMTIKAGGLIIDKGGLISATVTGGSGNSVSITVSGAATISGRLDASSVVLNGTGGDGGSIALTSSDTCQINGAVVANGAPTGSVGGGGGDISLECGTLSIAGGGIVDASGSGPGGSGGNISLGSSVNGMTLSTGSTVRALGSALDGGAISLSTDAGNPTDDCLLGGKVVVDSKSISNVGGSGGSIDISCGGDVQLTDRGLLTLSGIQGGGAASIFAGGGVAVVKTAAIKANAVGGVASGGNVDVAAGGDVFINGKIEARSSGAIGNNGEISVTNGGNLNIQGKGATLNVSAAHKDQQTGQITLAAGVTDGSTSPILNVGSGAALKVDGYGGGFGGLDVDISGSTCTLAGKIQGGAQAQNGVAIGFTCDNMTFAAGSLVQATATASGAAPTGTTGGSLTIDTTGASGGVPGACQFGGKVSLKAASANFVDAVTGTPRVAPGTGGNVVANCGAGLSVPSGGVIDVGAGGVQSHGGTVSLSAGNAADVQGGISARAGGGASAGGSIAIVAPDLQFEAMPGTIDVSGASGGLIQMTTAAPGGSGSVNVGKVFNAKGSASGGTVIVMGCDVTVAHTGWLSADASITGGSNQISGGKTLTISGKVTATSNGSNHVYSSSPSFSGTIKPQPKFDAPPFCF